MDEQRNKIIVGAVVVTIVVVATMFLVFRSSSPTCALTDTKPLKIDLSKIEGFATTDNTALTFLDAYLTYPSGKVDVEDNYLPLQLNKLTVDKTDSGHQVVLETNCATINMDFDVVTLTGITNNALKSIHIDLKLPNGDQNSCDVTGSLMPSFPVGNSYHCLNYKKYDCVKSIPDKNGATTKQTVVSLMIGTLELELDGDPEKIKKHLFSKPTYNC